MLERAALVLVGIIVGGAVGAGLVILADPSQSELDAAAREVTDATAAAAANAAAKERSIVDLRRKIESHEADKKKSDELVDTLTKKLAALQESHDNFESLARGRRETWDTEMLKRAKNIEITSQKLVTVEDDEFGGGMITKFRIGARNENDHVISKLGCHVVVSVPGRSAPWFEDTVDLPIPGGLGPNEADTWFIDPRRYYGWHPQELPANATLVVKVASVEWPGMPSWP